MYTINIYVLTCLHAWLTRFSCSVFSPFILMAVLLNNLLFLKKTPSISQKTTTVLFMWTWVPDVMCRYRILRSSFTVAEYGTGIQYTWVWFWWCYQSMPWRLWTRSILSESRWQWYKNGLCILECFTQEAPQSRHLLCIWFLNNHLGVNLLCLTPLHCSLNDRCSTREKRSLRLWGW